MTTLRWGSATDVGTVRANNEDLLLVAPPLFAVADGVGGHRGGEVASQTAIDALRDSFEGKTRAADLVEAVRAANRAVWDGASANRDLRGMGTTLTAIAVVEAEDGSEQFAVVNVGDSRSYLLRDGELERLTDDHNVPGEMLKRGEITEAEAATHPQKNLITRMMGNDAEVEVDLWELVPYAGDRLLLASDGLAGEVDDAEIASVLRRQPDAEAVAHELIELAKRSGSTDNITVVVVDVTDDDGRAETASAALADAPPARSLAGEKTSTVKAVEDPDAPSAVSAQDRRISAESAPGRRRRGVSGRAIAFVVLVLLVLGAAFGVINWYGRSAYHVGLAGDRVTIFQGRPGGFLWLQPSVVETTRLRAEDVLPSRRDDLRAGHAEPSLNAARRFVDNLGEEAAAATTTTTVAATTTIVTSSTVTAASTPTTHGP